MIDIYNIIEYYLLLDNEESIKLLRTDQTNNIEKRLPFRDIIELYDTYYNSSQLAAKLKNKSGWFGWNNVVTLIAKSEAENRERGGQDVRIGSEIKEAFKFKKTQKTILLTYKNIHATEDKLKFI